MAGRAVIRTLAQAVDVAAFRSPQNLALASPFQPGRFAAMDYRALRDATVRLAQGLTERFPDGAAGPGGVLVSDLPNVAENLLLQIACNRIGLGFATAKDAKVLDKLRAAEGVTVLGAVTADDDGFLAGAPLEAHIGDEELNALLDTDAPAVTNDKIAAVDYGVTEDNAHAYFNSPTPLTNGAILEQGDDAGAVLAITEHDKICVSITLCHAFGIASACAGAFLAGAAVVLPAVGGIRGCGVPSQRAEATLETLAREQCTMLFADTHTLKALPEPTTDLALKGGAVKIGSGSDFLYETREYAGVLLTTLGKKPAADGKSPMHWTHGLGWQPRRYLGGGKRNGKKN